MKNIHNLRRPLYILFLSVLLIGGCSSSDIPSTPDGTINSIIDGLKDNQADIIWKVLPVSYQEDLNGVVHNFANKMDEELYNKSFMLINKGVDLLRDKKEFFLNSSLGKKSEIEENKMIAGILWGSGIDAIETLTTSDISNLSSLKTINLGDFLSTTGNRLMVKVNSLNFLLQEKTKNNDYTDVSNVRLVSLEGDDAVINIIFNDGRNKELSMTKIEGRWILSEMAKNWKNNIEKANSSISKISSDNITKIKSTALSAIAEINTMFDKLSNANDQKQFDKTLIEIQMAVGLITLGIFLAG